MIAITSHVLDASRGRPAAGIGVTLSRQAEDGAWQTLAQGATDDDGRIGDLFESGPALDTGVYCLHLESGAYYATRGLESFHPYVDVVFRVADPEEHHHVAVLLSPFGYTTYRGS